MTFEGIWFPHLVFSVLLAEYGERTKISHVESLGSYIMLVFTLVRLYLGKRLAWRMATWHA